MTDAQTPEVVATLEDDTGDFCVDILRNPDGTFEFVEFARDPDDGDAWHQQSDATQQSFKTQYAAYVAAARAVDWLIA